MALERNARRSTQSLLVLVRLAGRVAAQLVVARDLLGSEERPHAPMRLEMREAVLAFQRRRRAYGFGKRSFIDLAGAKERLHFELRVGQAPTNRARLGLVRVHQALGRSP